LDGEADVERRIIVDLANPVLKLCADGMIAEQEGRQEEAAALFTRAWELGADDYDRCVAAHYLARHQPDAAETLRWNLLALQHAERVPEERIGPFYPSLYVSTGLAYEKLDQLTPARGAFLQAKAHLSELPTATEAEQDYSDVLRAGVVAGLQRLQVRSLAVVLLVDRQGRILLQLRDEHAPNHPNVWGLPGGHIEPDEEPEPAARRELLEETGVAAPGPLPLFAHAMVPEWALEKFYFCAATDAVDADIVLGEGTAMVFCTPQELLDGRPYTPNTLEMLRHFLASTTYNELAGNA
jgi:8-oxo-dGTP diphosphatase